jgi:type I restriction enzyme S subunit
MTNLEDVVVIRDDLRKPVNATERSSRIGPYPYYGATGQVGWIDAYLMDGEYILLGEDGAPFLDPSKDKAYRVVGKSWVNNHAHVLHGADGVVDNRYLLYALNNTDYRQFANGTTRLKLTQGAMRRIPIPVAPPNEQRRIVARIEELFSDLDAGVAALKRAKANLRRYRAAVLKAAVEGKLTEDWRARHPAKEPASKLLARILQERRQKWEAEQLARFAAAKKEPPKNWREKYVEPAPPETAGLPELPESWCWVSIDQIAECLDNQRIPVNKAERANRMGDIPYYGANGLVGYINDFIFDEPLVLVVEDETFVGREKPFSYLITGKAWVNNHAHVLRSTSATTAAFLNYALMFYPFIPMTTGTTARRKLTRQRLMEAPFALPPFDEQVEIVQAIEVRLSNGDYTDASINASLARGARLRQSILKQAFEGKLVPQDPADEPASVLLERLQANRSGNDRNGTATTQSRPRGRRRKSKTTGREV